MSNSQIDINIFVDYHRFIIIIIIFIYNTITCMAVAILIVLYTGKISVKNNRSKDYFIEKNIISQIFLI